MSLLKIKCWCELCETGAYFETRELSEQNHDRLWREYHAAHAARERALWQDAFGSPDATPNRPALPWDEWLERTNALLRDCEERRG